MHKRDRQIAGIVIAGVIIFAIGAITFTVKTVKQANDDGTVSKSHDDESSAQATPATGSDQSPSGTNNQSSSSTTTANSPQCIDVSQAASDEGNDECVQFVGYEYTSSGGSMYLDQSLSAPYGFSVYIPAGTSFGSSVLSEYSGKTVDVSGTIINYRGESEIQLTDPSQIQLAN